MDLLSWADTMMDAEDAEIIAVSGLSYYYSSAEAVPVLAEVDVDVISAANKLTNKQ